MYLVFITMGSKKFEWALLCIRHTSLSQKALISLCFISKFDFLATTTFANLKSAWTNIMAWITIAENWFHQPKGKECASTQAWLVYVGMTHLSSLIGQVWSNLLSYYIHHIGWNKFWKNTKRSPNFRCVFFFHFCPFCKKLTTDNFFTY